MILQDNFCIIKHVASNGQISLGKEYAGKQVQISKLEGGDLLIQLGRFIPDNERWLYKGRNSEALDKGIQWAESHPRRENFDEIEKAIENE